MKITQKGARFELPLSTINRATKLASASYLKYSNTNNSSSPYLQNTSHSHVVGKIGEVGCSYALKSLGFKVNELFNDNNDTKCDIVINNTRIEIKCWTVKVWGQFGACIAEKQALKIHKKADIVLYCTYDDANNIFTLRGWNRTADILLATPQITGSKNQVLNRTMNEIKLNTNSSMAEFRNLLNYIQKGAA
jgi:hypothetical protein